MANIFDACTPRDEVLKGELRDEMFAARLKDAVDGNADPLYRTARAFFENTYPTEGLKTLVREVLGRLTRKAPSASSFIRLERGRREPFSVDEVEDVRLGVLFSAGKPLRRVDRTQAIAEHVARTEPEELYYRFSKMTSCTDGDRARRTLRVMMAQE